MNIYDLTISQLKRAATIKEQIEDLNRELRSILGMASASRALPKKRGGMTSSIKKKIAANQKARWANLRRAKATRSAKPAPKAKTKRMAPAARAKLSAMLMAYWAE